MPTSWDSTGTGLLSTLRALDLPHEVVEQVRLRLDQGSGWSASAAPARAGLDDLHAA